MSRAMLIPALVICNLVAFAIILWQAALLREYKTVSRLPPEQTDLQSNSPSQRGPMTEGIPESSNYQLPDQARNPSSLSARQIIAARAETRRTPLTWKEVESDDYHTYVKNLRHIGVPDSTVRDIVTADVLQAFGTKRDNAIAERYQDFEFWKSTPRDTRARAELEKQRRAIDEEMEFVMTELLGIGSAIPTGSEWKTAELNHLLAFLPEDKRNEARMILLRHSESDRRVQQLSSNITLTEDTNLRRKFIEEYEDKKAQLKRLLSSDEYERVELLTSFTSENLRRAMVHFQPTEAEFRMLFREWQDYDEQLARRHAFGEPDPGDLRKPLEARVQEFLGPERAAEFWATWWKAPSVAE